MMAVYGKSMGVSGGVGPGMGKRVVAIVACVAMMAAAGVAIFLQIMMGKGDSSGIDPDESHDVHVTCLNPSCPGLHSEIDEQGRTVRGVAHAWYETRKAGFGDWPVPCSKCVEQLGSDYVFELDREAFTTKHFYDPGASSFTGRSGFYLGHCIECGARYGIRNLTKKSYMRCPNPDCITNGGGRP